jgi:hypothetical protein
LCDAKQTEILLQIRFANIPTVESVALRIGKIPFQCILPGQMHNNRVTWRVTARPNQTPSSGGVEQDEVTIRGFETLCDCDVDDEVHYSEIEVDAAPQEPLSQRF